MVRRLVRVWADSAAACSPLQHALNARALEVLKYLRQLLDCFIHEQVTPQDAQESAAKGLQASGKDAARQAKATARSAGEKHARICEHLAMGASPELNRAQSAVLKAGISIQCRARATGSAIAVPTSAMKQCMILCAGKAVEAGPEQKAPGFFQRLGLGQPVDAEEP